MSENTLRFASAHPDDSPSRRALDRAATLLVAAFPRAQTIELVEHGEVRFVDNGANLERVRCPTCGADLLENDAWPDAMSEAHATSFEDRSFETVCCGARHSLEELDYHWPVAFSRFSIDVREPDAAVFIPGEPPTAFEADLLAQLRSTLGGPVVAVWQRI